MLLCAMTSQSCVDIESRRPGGSPNFTAQCGVAHRRAWMLVQPAIAATRETSTRTRTQSGGREYRRSPRSAGRVMKKAAYRR